MSDIITGAPGAIYLLRCGVVVGEAIKGRFVDTGATKYSLKVLRVSPTEESALFTLVGRRWNWFPEGRIVGWSDEITARAQIVKEILP